MSDRVIVLGGLPERYEVERLLCERHPELHVEAFGRPWEVVEHTTSAPFDVALILKGPIAEHDQRVETVASLRRNGFKGKVLYAGAFLTEKQDAVRAGADYAFDPDRQAVEQVVWAALRRTLVAADHPYLRTLFVGEWAEVSPYGDALPAQTPEILMVSTSCHPHADFYRGLARFVRDRENTCCILVEDGGTEEARVEALASGVQPHVVLAQEGLMRVFDLARGLLREYWLAGLSSA